MLQKASAAYDACTVTDDEIVRWQDREDHTDFDVCADDHCQRYQGVTRQSTAAVAEAVDATAGIALTDPDSGELADARFSKCCGGVFMLRFVPVMRRRTIRPEVPRSTATRSVMVPKSMPVRSRTRSESSSTP